MNPDDYVRYSDDVETIADDEAETSRKLNAALRAISETTFSDSGHALRSVHAKSNGLLRGELVVAEGLPGPLQQGAFRRPGRYAVVARLSSAPGDLLPDSVSTPRGFALKIIAVEGERLPGSEDASTQDLVMVNGPAFRVPDAKGFLKGLELLAKTTDRIEGLKVAASAVLRGTERLLEAVGGGSGTLKSLGGEPAHHPLGETYYTQVPVRYGDYLAKLSLAPVSPELLALKGAPVDLHASPDALRAAVNAYFAAHGGQWELRVQLCTDLKTMPVEDASVVWPEDQSPYLAVGRVSFAAQAAWTDARAKVVDDGLAFSPWHGLAAHRPLGSVMRARRSAYDASAAFRGEHNGCPIHEPASLSGIR